MTEIATIRQKLRDVKVQVIANPCNHTMMQRIKTYANSPSFIEHGFEQNITHPTCTTRLLSTDQRKTGRNSIQTVVPHNSHLILGTIL